MVSCFGKGEVEWYRCIHTHRPLLSLKYFIGYMLVNIRKVTVELSTCKSRLSFLLSTLLVMLAELATIVAFHMVDLSTWSSLEAPLLPKVSSVFRFLAKIRSCLHKASLVCFFLGSIDLFFHDHVIYPHPSVSRICDLLR